MSPKPTKPQSDRHRRRLSKVYLKRWVACDGDPDRIDQNFSEKFLRLYLRAGNAGRRAYD